MQNGIMDLETLRICSDKDRGMRKYMEDELSIVTETDPVPATFLGIFDGHGGKEASMYAKEHLFHNIKIQPGFATSDVDRVKESIRQGFLKTHHDMFNILGKCLSYLKYISFFLIYSLKKMRVTVTYDNQVHN